MNYITLSLTLFLSTFSYSDNNNPDNIYGYWLNNDSEILLIQTNNTFTRSDKFSVLAEGEIQFIDNKILVYRTDTIQEYILEYYLGNETLVVMKPNSQEEAWLFSRIGN
jgi:hypothetical protein|tara:strand:+ start:120 stop:446 length:327 start_codon:yes stop_codon:yes gene_type:complete